MRAVFLEYAWDMGWCDPCAADPLSMQELRKLGVFWLSASGADERLRRRLPGGAADADRGNFQGRYVLRHPWKGEATCEAGRARHGVA
jgi:hypothetical protein